MYGFLQDYSLKSWVNRRLVTLFRETWARFPHPPCPDCSGSRLKVARMGRRQ